MDGWFGYVPDHNTFNNIFVTERMETMTGRDRLQKLSADIQEKFLAQFPETMRKYYKKLAKRMSEITYNPQDNELGVNAASRRRRQIEKGILRKDNGYAHGPNIV